MKRGILYFLLLVIAETSFSQRVTFMPSWIEQTQWAGYYIAKEKGFYDELGVDVSIVHPPLNSSISVVEEIKSGNSDIISAQLPDVLIAYEHGIKLVNILQTSQNSSLLCVTRKPISSINDLNGMRIGRWKSGFGRLFDIIQNRYKLKIDWIPFNRGVNLFVYGAVDAILCYRYNEYYMLLASVGSINENCIISSSDVGFNFPEEGLYVSEEYYLNHKDLIDKFVAASIRGWEYVREHKEEAYSCSMEYLKRNNIPINIFVQKNMLEEVLKLQVNPVTHKADYAPVSTFVFEQINNSLIDCGQLHTKINYNDIFKVR